VKRECFKICFFKFNLYRYTEAHQQALSDVANVRAHFETLAAAGKPRADAALAAAMESLGAELAEARRQR
jgi:hypothetical protein